MSAARTRAAVWSRVLFGALALAPAGAQARSSFDLSVDPRVELLGIIQHLAGHGKTCAAYPQYVRDVDEHFGRFKDHPAVRLYEEAYLRDPGRDGFGIELLYYSAPPALELKFRSALLPYVDTEDEQQIAQRFLWELRSFAAVSDFDGFFRAHAEFYQSVEAAERRQLGAIDPIARLEAYLGISLESRCHYYLPLLYLNTYHSSFIEPYPDPVSLKRPVLDPFEVWTVVQLGGVSSPGKSVLPRLLWQEPLYVFVDPSFHFFEAANIPDPAVFYGPSAAACRADSANCVKGYLVAALVERLSPTAAVPGAHEDGSPDFLRTVKALSRRLEEYEEHRDRYPTLWDFYPRLFSVFHELAFPAGAAVALRVPAAGPVRRTTDFFSPEFRSRAAKEKR